MMMNEFRSSLVCWNYAKYSPKLSSTAKKPTDAHYFIKSAYPNMMQDPPTKTLLGLQEYSNCNACKRQWSLAHKTCGWSALGINKS